MKSLYVIRLAKYAIGAANLIAARTAATHAARAPKKIEPLQQTRHLPIPYTSRPDNALQSQRPCDWFISIAIGSGTQINRDDPGLSRLNKSIARKQIVIVFFSDKSPSLKDNRDWLLRLGGELPLQKLPYRNGCNSEILV